LGIDVFFLAPTRRRGALVAPYKYTIQAIQTIRLLLSRRPRTVFVQSPPSPAALLIAAYGAITGTRLVVDAHSDAMLRSYWTRPARLYSWLARRADATIVTNDHFASTIEAQGGKALVIRDIPTEFPTGGIFDPDDGFTVAVVNTFADDEPLAAILAAAEALPRVTFYVTGRIDRAPAGLVDSAPDNVRFTGFLDDADYYEMLRRTGAVMCLTTRNHTMQRGACEALSLGRPIITSNWPLLRDYFGRGAVHVDAVPEEIREGVVAIMADHARYEREIAEQQQVQQQEWTRALTALSGLLEGPETRGVR
jgi:glycosyltransferase involved in cell wall biosynthesis